MAEQTLEQAPTRVLERRIAVTAERVYDALTNPIGLREWLCANALRSNAQEGGAIFLTWNNNYHTTATFLKLEENSKVKFHWQGKDEESFKVKFLIEADGDSTQVTLKTDGETEHVNWDNALDNLKTVLETGWDERLTKRAILGVIPVGFDADIAKKIGVPVTEGARFSGTVPGSGAEAAGLQGDDVIVMIDGTAIANGFDIPRAVGNKRAGDNVDVEFYRGADKQSATFALSSMPLPEVPETKEAFADQVQEIYEKLDGELQDFFADVSEDDASKAPAEGEWSANETLWHLVNTELWLHEWIGAFISGQEMQSFSPNQYERSVASAIGASGKEAVVSAMRQAQDTTVALIRNLPDDFVTNRKATYIRIGLNALGLPNHNRGHFQQMQAAIASARGE